MFGPSALRISGQSISFGTFVCIWLSMYVNILLFCSLIYFLLGRSVYFLFHCDFGGISISFFVAFKVNFIFQEELGNILVFYSLILHPVAREIQFNHIATSRNHFSYSN
jgi:hypothetical protein